MELGMPVSVRKNGMFGNNDMEGLITSGSSDEESEPESEPKSKRKDGRRQKSKQPTPDSDTEEDVLPTTAHTKHKRRILRGRKGQNFSSSDEDMEMEDPKPAQKKKRILRGKHKHPTPDSAGEENENSASGNEKEDLKRDLDFLRSSSPPAQYQGRNKEKSQRQKALEALKRKRAGNGSGNSSAVPSSSAPTPGRRRAVLDSDSDASLEVIKEEEDSAESDAAQNEGAPEGTDEDGDSDPGQTRASDIFRNNNDDADFIDDEQEDVIGEPAELPLEFSSLGRAKPKELFKYAVEWMVYKKINPAFSSNAEIYTLAFRKLDDEVKGLANSKYSSAAWTPEFTRALRARPEITVDEIGKQERSLMAAHCEACNRRTHPASFHITFTGKPYNKDTLEPEEEDSSSSDSSSSSSDSDISESESENAGPNGEKPTYDRYGELIPPESKVFSVGKTCKANAQMSHTLHHWRHHLYSWIVSWLGSNGYCTPEQLAKRDKQSNRKREKAANKIIKKMEDTGEIKRLHKLYKDQIDYALQEKDDALDRWGRG
jgi:hypothetical protein